MPFFQPLPISPTPSNHNHYSTLFLHVQCFISDTRKYFGEGNGTPLQYSCLENPIDGGAW